jgi:hypothetical protein
MADHLLLLLDAAFIFVQDHGHPSAAKAGSVRESQLNAAAPYASDAMQASNLATGRQQNGDASAACLLVDYTNSCWYKKVRISFSPIQMS